MEYPVYEDFCNALDLGRTRVVVPHPIFLCGGEISKAGSTTTSSCRDYFLKHVRDRNPALSERIVLAEQVIEFFHQSEYKDLLTFERELAELSFMTVVFVESAGSIAELGSFSVLTEIHSRLMVVVQARHADSKSFIWHGPVRYLQEEVAPTSDRTVVCVYDWDEETGDFPDAADMVEILTDLVDKEAQTERLSTSKPGHLMMLIQELVSIQRITTLPEICDLLDALGIEAAQGVLKRWLSLLTSLGYMAKTRFGHNVFYIATDQPQRVQLAYSEAAEVKDSARWQTLFLEHYERSEERKHRALQAHHRQLAQGEDERV